MDILSRNTWLLRQFNEATKWISCSEWCSISFIYLSLIVVVIVVSSAQRVNTKCCSEYFRRIPFIDCWRGVDRWTELVWLIIRLEMQPKTFYLSNSIGTRDVGWTRNRSSTTERCLLELIGRCRKIRKRKWKRSLPFTFIIHRLHCVNLNDGVTDVACISWAPRRKQNKTNAVQSIWKRNRSI